MAEKKIDKTTMMYPTMHLFIELYQQNANIPENSTQVQQFTPPCALETNDFGIIN